MSETERQVRVLAAAALAGAALAPARLLHGGPTLCAFRRLTGRPCPACGITRSWNAAARLDLGGSLRFHPLGLPTFAAALVAATTPADRLPAWARSTPVLGTLVVAWLATWLVRFARG